jgi:hypothetical protein
MTILDIRLQAVEAERRLTVAGIMLLRATRLLEARQRIMAEAVAKKEESGINEEQIVESKEDVAMAEAERVCAARLLGILSRQILPPTTE